MKSWLINPREPFNSRVWQEIAAELFVAQIKDGAAWLSLGRDGRTVRLVRDTGENEGIDRVE